MLGVVSIDIGITEFSYFLGNLNISKHGKTFVLNNKNEIIAIPTKKNEDIRKKLLDEYTVKGKKHYKFVNIEKIADPVIQESFRTNYRTKNFYRCF